MESSFKLIGVKSEYTAPPARMPEPRHMKRGKTYRLSIRMRLAWARIMNDDDWSAMELAEASERRSYYTRRVTKLLRTSTAAHHEQVARLSARRASVAPIASTQPDLVLSTATPNGPNTSPISPLIPSTSEIGLEVVTR